MMKSFTSGVEDEFHKEKMKKREERLKKKMNKFKNIVLNHIEDIVQDIENVYDEITAQAGDHFNPKDIILTYSKSDLLVSFLRYAYYGGENNER